MMMPGRYEMPIGMREAELADITGWPFTVLEEQPYEKVINLVLFRTTKEVLKNGGTMKWL